MKSAFVSIALLFTSCSAMPQLFHTIDDIATDDAITVKVDKDAFSEETDVTVNVYIKNKSAP